MDARVSFFGEAMVVVEAEFEAMMREDLSNRLYAQWVEEGSPKQIKKWLRLKLRDLFRSIGQRPRWVRRPDGQDWQYHDGQPMTFLGQIDLPKFELSEGRRAGPLSIYVFATAVPVPEYPDRWRMIIKTTQDQKL